MIVGVMTSTLVSSEPSSDYDIKIQVGIVSLFNATSHFRASQSRSLTSSRSSPELRRQNASRSPYELPFGSQNHVPKQTKKDMYSLVKSKFIIHPNETIEITKMDLSEHEEKWRRWKGSLNTRVYDPSLAIDEIVAQQTKNDNRVNPTQFQKLVTSRFTSEFQSTCVTKRSSRSKMHEPHITGTKSFSRLAHEVVPGISSVPNHYVC
ncbi:hypothetical protein LXL04_002538 [Taraxacum kok-saghyz]